MQGGHSFASLLRPDKTVVLELWFDLQAFAGGGFALAVVKAEKYLCFQGQGGGDVQQVQAARAKHGRIAVAQPPGRVVERAGRDRHGREKAAGDVGLHVLPEGIALRGGEALAMHGAVEGIAKFQHGQRGERQRE